MKQFAYILLTLIVWLTIQPTFQLFVSSITSEEISDNNCCESDVNCLQGDDTKKQVPSDCCPGDICNPFQACACCCGGVVGSVSLAKIIFYIKKNNNIQSQNNLVLGFHSDCYHPPEVS